MFDGASAFNQPLRVGNVSNASDASDASPKRRRALGVTEGQGSYRRQLHFATSNVKDMSAMFRGAVAFNQP
eukprot:scaffold139114_cov232-Phaeocystis_antarctica.AAC.1